MKLNSALILASLISRGSAFHVAPAHGLQSKPTCVSLESRSTVLSASSDDCGCGPEILSGDVPEGARSVNPREALRKANVFRVSGESVSMDELIDRNENKLSVVVFLRSLG